MSRGIWFWCCAILGLVMLVCGLLVPAHLRAVDASVLQKAGRNSSALVARGLDLVSSHQFGPAQLLAQAAQDQRLPRWQEIGLTVDDSSRQHPGWLIWGGAEPRFEALFESDPAVPKTGSEPFTEFVIRLENRQRVLDFLAVSPHPAVKELLKIRSLTNTVLFPPSHSTAGQPLDAALSACGLLFEAGHVAPGLSNSLCALAVQANHGASSQPLEQALMDVMSLGQRMNWAQLWTFVSNIQDAETLRRQASLVRRSEDHLPLLFAAVELSGEPAEVAQYLMTYSQTGLKDLGASLRFGAAGLKELLRRGQRLETSDLGQRLGAYAPFSSLRAAASAYAWQFPQAVLAVKWALYLLAGFLLAAAMHFARPAVSLLEKPLQVRGFHIAREILFALGFLLVVLLLSEPFLAQESQKMELPFRLRLPMVGSAVAAVTHPEKPSFMNYSLLTLLLFFVLQGLLYTASVLKLAEIRRQRVPSRMKLKLLENEDHLFDAGLYLGFVGTIISLILVSLGVIKPSLMAAYSSTSFGIIFVSIFKIFHLRPTRRVLLLEAEAAAPESAVPSGRPSLVAAS